MTSFDIEGRDRTRLLVIASSNRNPIAPSYEAIPSEKFVVAEVIDRVQAVPCVRSRRLGIPGLPVSASSCRILLTSTRERFVCPHDTGKLEWRSARVWFEVAAPLPRDSPAPYKRTSRARLGKTTHECSVHKPPCTKRTSARQNMGDHRRSCSTGAWRADLT